MVRMGLLLLRYRRRRRRVLHDGLRVHGGSVCNMCCGDGRSQKGSVAMAWNPTDQRKADTREADANGRVTEMEHSEAAGTKCTFVDGMCAVCLVGEDTCYACNGVGYHSASCPESDANYEGGTS